MILTEMKPTHFIDNRLTQIHEDIKRLGALTTKLKTKRQQLTQLFEQASTAIEDISELIALVLQTSTEICAILEAIFQLDNCLISEVEPLPAARQTTLSHPLLQVANQLVPILKQGQPIINPLVSCLMTETFGGTDAEGNWLWKDAYESLETAQVMLIQQQGKQLLNKSDHSDVLGEIECIHRLCLTQSRRSETSIQLQQFSTPLPLAYVAHLAAQIDPDDLVLEPSAGTGILASFAQISGAQLLLNEICPKRRGILKELFPTTPVSGFNAEQIDDYLDSRYHPTVVLMNPPFSASPKIAKRNQAQPPLFRPVTTNVKSEKRFLSTIARRLDSLGALTRGQRQTGGQGLFREEDNLESPYAKAALRQLYHALHVGGLNCCSLNDFETHTGLSLTDKDGHFKEDLPPIAQFLNRVLALRIELQNALFEEFEVRLESKIEEAIAAGSYEIGVETLKAESFRVLERQVIYTHLETQAQTHCVKIERQCKAQVLSLQEALETADRHQSKLVANQRSGKVAVAIPTNSTVTDDGSIVRRVNLLRPTTNEKMSVGQFKASTWEEISQASFEQLWQQEVSQTSQFEVIHSI